MTTHKRREDREGQEGKNFYLVFQASSGREMNQNQNNHPVSDVFVT